MIEVKLCLEADNRIKSFAVTGHANFSEYGSDIVCAAVSAVTQTAVIGLQHYFGDAVAVQQEEGRLTCSLPVLEPGDALIAETILKTLYWGLRAIEAEYGEYLHLTVEGGVLE